KLLENYFAFYLFQLICLFTFPCMDILRLVLIDVLYGRLQIMRTWRLMHWLV
ncbi:hypothetical protein C1646_691373, partial [Rhizophagus diaphanus]